ncbi:uncharacterized protein LOC143483278 [Brachyhypopomus gauderio]|uniref:uncharacterized protein LOC143483278 n=1 Tax=Brachyhypopomus gauderio TaxID=698409 RepID=UPI0040431FDC
MVNNCSTAQTDITGVFSGSKELCIVFGVVSGMLIFSLCWNILCCIQKHWTATGKAFLPCFRKSLKRNMEDNPIYGNITYRQTRYNKEEECPSETPSSGRECYANLTLKVPKSASGRSSPVSQIQYSEMKAVSEATAEQEDNTQEKDTCSIMSDLYASVDMEHIRRKKHDSNEAYANHV